MYLIACGWFVATGFSSAQVVVQGSVLLLTVQLTIFSIALTYCYTTSCVRSASHSLPRFRNIVLHHILVDCVSSCGTTAIGALSLEPVSILL